MPALKDRIKNPTQDRILEAAVQLFSRQGFTGSSTHEIARLAGVNEVTVFRHFPRKKDLFWAATESRLRRLRISRELRNRLERDEIRELRCRGLLSCWWKLCINTPRPFDCFISVYLSWIMAQIVFYASIWYHSFNLFANICAAVHQKA